MPFELRPAPTPTLRPDGDYLQRAWTQSVYPMARSLGVEIKLPSVSPQPYTNLAFQGLEFAKEHGKGDEYNDAAMKAFFQQSRDIGSLEELTKIAAQVGLEPGAFRSALETGKYRDRVSELLRVAHEQVHVNAVPTMIIGEQMLQGLYPEDVIRQVIEQESARIVSEP